MVYKWDSNVPGKSAGPISWSFAAAGRGNFFDFDQSIAQSTYQALIRDAFKLWSDVAAITFKEVTDSRSSEIRLGWDAIDGAENMYGQASWSTQRYGELVKAEVRFDSAEKWDASTFLALAIHEIGHAIGLDHADDPDSIMYPIVSEDHLHASDVAAIQYLYGPRATPPAVEMKPVNGGHGSHFHKTEDAAGSDTFRPVAGDERIVGGAGLDKVIIDGESATFAIRLGAAGEVIVEGKGRSAPAGTDTLVDIERLAFSDGTVAFDVEGNAGQAYRLYQAAFDRVPDAAGLGYWIDAIDAGSQSLTSAATQFLGSREFAQTYGASSTVTAEEFVDLLYRNVLDRVPDPAGYDFWLGRMGSDLQRQDVLALFSDSAENKVKVLPDIHDGIWFV